MDMTTGVFFLALAILAVSAGYIEHHPEHHEVHETKKDYNFDYTVHDPHTHDYHSHQESSKHGVVKGYYAIKDADGSLREVHYTADPKEGFKAIVTKNGVQVDPQPEQHQQHHEESSADDLGHQDFGGHEEYSGHHFFR